MPDRDETRTDLPAEFVDALNNFDRAPAVVTRAVDRTLVDAAEANFAGRRARPGWRRSGGWVALAASVALVTVLAVRRDDGPASLYADVDASGRIDIADVLVLARTGNADPSELEAFAQRVVALDGGTTR